MLHVALVLRSGGDFKPRHVERLRRQVARHLHRPYMTTVLTDLPRGEFQLGARVVGLAQAWPGWWSKLELFRPGVFHAGDRVLYLDLDTTVVGDLTDLAEVNDDLAMLDDFYFGNAGAAKRRGQLGSGVMAFRPHGSLQRVYEAFAKHPQTRYSGGDQRFVANVYPGHIGRLQERVPGQIVSYKAHCGDGVPADARLVCHHGKPRPWEVE